MSVAPVAWVTPWSSPSQDDHTRLVYAELHSAENAANVSITLQHGAAWMRDRGCGPIQAVMSDNAKCYTGHEFARTLSELGARHIRIPPSTCRGILRRRRRLGPRRVTTGARPGLTALRVNVG
jgi:transposase InsO family protein